MEDWKLADAKNRFSELVDRAISQGPQRVCRGKDTVVVISSQDYDRLRGNAPSLKSYLIIGEIFEGLDLERDQT